MRELLDLCLGVTGSFENGHPDYDAVTGNFDGQGMSVGVLQWCALPGSLGTLVARIQSKIGDQIDSYTSVPVSPLASMKGPEALEYVKTNFLDETGAVLPEALEGWKNLLSTEHSVASQIELALEGPLGKARHLTMEFVPEESMRAIAFFFDLVTQSGGMRNKRGEVLPISIDQANCTEAIQFATSFSPKSAQLWTQVTSQDPLAKLLLYYAYERAKLGRQEYIWDALSRRGTIACRRGVVHGKLYDFTSLFP